MPCPVRALNVADNVVVGYISHFFSNLKKAVLSGLIKWEDAFEMWSSHYTPSTEDSKPIGKVLIIGLMGKRAGSKSKKGNFVSERIVIFLAIQLFILHSLIYANELFSPMVANQNTKLFFTCPIGGPESKIGTL